MRHRLRFAAGLLCLLLCTLPAGTAQALDIVALRGSVRIEGIEGPVFEKAGDVRHSPASLTKVMTILLALESGRLEERTTISHRAAASGGSSLYLQPGSEWLIRDLVYAAQLISANDASAAIAEHLGGSLEGFADMMNERARQLGMLNTNFVNPHGMPHNQQYSTANDMTLLGLAAAAMPEFVEIATTRRYQTENSTALANQNKLLGSYEGLILGKTGYTTQAGQCFVVVAERGGLRVASAIMGSEGQNIWSDSEALLDYGFANYRRTVLFRNRQTLGVVDVPLAGPTIVVATAEYSFVSSAYGRPDAKFEIYPYEALWPPLRPGDIVGEVVVRVGGQVTVLPVTVAHYVPLFTPQRLKAALAASVVFVMYVTAAVYATKRRKDK